MTDSNVELSVEATILRIEEFLTKHEQGSVINKKKKVADIIRKASAEFEMNRVPDVPDYPSCDYCGDEFAGKLFCSQCRCAFYCSKVSEPMFTVKV